MSILKFTVVDCGGTSTKWAFHTTDGTTNYTETSSFHPKYAFHFSEDELNDYFKNLPDLSKTPLFFYSAGCGSVENSTRMKTILEQQTHANVSVFSDALGACRACCGNEKGIVAILGTGSILLEYSGTSIERRHGGFGSLIGDEGSGFYAGKLILQAYLDDFSDLSNDLRLEMEKTIGSKAFILQQLALPIAQSFIASVSELTFNLDFQSFHKQNLNLFFNSHLPKTENSNLHIVGSYGYYRKDLLIQLIEKYDWKMGKVLKSSLDGLVEYHL